MFEFFSWYLFVKLMDDRFLTGESDTVGVEEIQSIFTDLGEALRHKIMLENPQVMDRYSRQTVLAWLVSWVLKKPCTCMWYVHCSNIAVSLF